MVQETDIKADIKGSNKIHEQFVMHKLNMSLSHK